MAQIWLRARMVENLEKFRDRPAHAAVQSMVTQDQPRKATR
jgi:hypothetical protein